MKFLIAHENIFIAIGASFIGTLSRISHEREVVTIHKRKAMSYLSASFFVGYMVYQLFLWFGWVALIGPGCAVGGLVSVNVVELLIKHLPGILLIKARKALNVEKESHDSDNN